MTRAETLAWEAPGPYCVAFSTRNGGVSEAEFRSLNLGALTRDDPERVLENRARLCAAVSADGSRASMAWQHHSADVVRAEPLGILAPAQHERCDGLWTDEPGLAMLVLTADCLPIVLVRNDGDPPAAAVLHAGWRGLLGGIVAGGARALGGGALAAVVGPGIGPCCYEVGEEVAGPFRERFGDEVVSDGKLDLWASAERALRAAGVGEVERFDRCTSCEPDTFFSHRRDHGRTGRQGVIAYVSG